MKISFRTKKLLKQYQFSKEAEKAYGKDVARKFIQRVNIIKKSRDIDELCSDGMRTLRCHPLKGNRKGQWAIKLTGAYRLIFTLEGEHLLIAMIEEVSNHYDD